MATTTDLTRRRFLQAGGWAAGAAYLGLTPTPGLARPATSSRHKRLLALRNDLKGRLILPSEPGYALAAWPNNARWADVHPQAVAMCADDHDVQLCVGWARDERRPFAIRSGGHNYAGFSTTPGLLLDVKAMNRVRADFSQGVVVVQGGANNQDVATALRPRNVAVPSGRCPTVGTAGLVLGGGWGFSATRSGLTCDSLLETTLVSATAERWIINDHNDKSDLFWAVRGGGGGNFGVHTSFTFKLHDVGEVTTFNLVWPPGKQVELLTALQKMQIENARTISTRSKARPETAGAFPDRTRIVVETVGLYWGTETDLRAILAPVFDILQPQTADIYHTDYWRARDYLLTDDPNGLYDIRCSYVETALSGDALETMLTWMSRWPGGALRQENMGILFAIGGAVRDKKSDDTAYYHRNANYIFEMEASWSPIDQPSLVARQRAWLRAYYDDMQRFLLPQSYVNFPNRELPNYAQAYYGKNIDQLSRIKDKYDRNDLFKFVQSIPTTWPPR